MKMASVRELRNHYSKLMRWIEAGEEIAISRRGKVVARLVPEKNGASMMVDWGDSAALRRDKRQLPLLTASESQSLLAENQGRW